MRYLIIFIGLAAATAHAQGLDPSGKKTPSEQISIGAVSIVLAPSAGSEAGRPVTGTLLGSALGSAYIITGIAEAGADAVTLLLESAQASGKASVTVARSALEQSGLAIGKSVQAVSASGGTLLVASGKVLAFIPNTLGQALLHEARLAGATP
ncbi:MAG TPA: hypothetical protein VLC08_09625 [Chitinolyticbacter sp.]|nr:hypothetical protein [Chitinolyticbacter sp.]